jgi:uncharacterized protein (TIGR02118 family)
MPTVFAVYNAKDAKSADEYEKYLKEKKIAIIRSLPIIKSYEIYRIDGVVAPAIANAQNVPSQLPYQFVAKMEISSLEEYAQAARSPERQAFVKEYSAYLDPSGPLNVFTLGHKVEPRT